MDRNEEKLYEIFREMEITDYTVTEHEAIMSIEEADQFGLVMEGLNVKNLFIKEKKTDRYFMVILDDHRHADLKHFKELAGWKQNRFANGEELEAVLGILPGAVTPLALFNDTNHQVTVVLGKEIGEADATEKISFHPCRNTATLTMRKGDFLKFLEKMGNYLIVEK